MCALCSALTTSIGSHDSSLSAEIACEQPATPTQAPAMLARGTSVVVVDNYADIINSDSAPESE
jgi:hypothetical protein